MENSARVKTLNDAVKIRENILLSLEAVNLKKDPAKDKSI